VLKRQAQTQGKQHIFEAPKITKYKGLQITIENPNDILSKYYYSRFNLILEQDDFDYRSSSLTLSLSGKGDLKLDGLPILDK
jgi:hypothetical protein